MDKFESRKDRIAAGICDTEIETDNKIKNILLNSSAISGCGKKLT